MLWFCHRIIMLQSSSNQNNNQSGSASQDFDDREGYLKHPKRGRVETYLMEVRINIEAFGHSSKQ